MKLKKLKSKKKAVEAIDLCLNILLNLFNKI